MAEGLVLGLIAAAAFLLGWLLVWQFGPPHHFIPGGWLAAGFASLIMGIIVLGWLGLVLAEIGLFSAGRLASLWLVLCGGLGFRSWHIRPNPAAMRVPEKPASRWPMLPSRLEVLFLGAWLVAALWLFFRPHEYIIGGADAGVYVNLAASIARQESIVIQDETLAALDQALYPALLRAIPPAQGASQAAPYYLLPGFYVPGTPAGQVVPQFYPLHPVWQAVAYDLGQPLGVGLEAALLLTGLWTVLSGLAIYLTVRELAGWEAAAVALTALSLSGLQVWFARYPTTEMLTQLLIWTGLWALTVWLGPAAGWSGQPSQPAGTRFWGLLAGLALGQVFLVRVDTYPLLIVPAGLWMALRRRGRSSGGHWWFFLPLACLTFHSLVHAYWQSRPYLYSIFGVAQRLGQQSWLLPLAAGVGAVLLVAAGYLATHQSHSANRLASLKRPAAVTAVAAIIVLALYGWFIRPQVGGVEGTYADWFGGGAIPRMLDRENLVRLGWYLSPLGIALATAGTCLLIWYADRRTAPLLVVGLMFSLLYLWRVQANPHQVYVMRRYVPVVVPYAIVAATYGLHRLAEHQSNWFRAAAVIVAVIWLAGLGWLARGFVTQVDYQGITGQMAALNRQLDPNSILLFDDQAAVSLGDFVGTPLQYLYDHRAFSLRDPDALDTPLLQETIRAWQQAGRTIYWVGEPSRLPELALSAGQSFSATISVEFLEGTYDRKPTRLLPLHWTLVITPIQGAGR